MSTATGIDTEAYSKRDSVSGTPGNTCPNATPATIPAATQMVRYRPKIPSPPVDESFDGGCSALRVSLVVTSGWASSTTRRR